MTEMGWCACGIIIRRDVKGLDAVDEARELNADDRQIPPALAQSPADKGHFAAPSLAPPPAKDRRA